MWQCCASPLPTQASRRLSSPPRSLTTPPTTASGWHLLGWDFRNPLRDSDSSLCEKFCDHLSLFSRWHSTPGIVGCTQSTSSSMWSLQASSEKFTKCFLKTPLLDLQHFGENPVFWENLIDQLQQLNCIQWKTQLLLPIVNRGCWWDETIFQEMFITLPLPKTVFIE